MQAKSNEVTMPVGPDHDILTDKVAIDCEMMRSNIGQVLGHVSVVNYEGLTIFDTASQGRWMHLEWSGKGCFYPVVQQGGRCTYSTDCQSLSCQPLG
jgi:hypothetical protein